MTAPPKEHDAHVASWRAWLDDLHRQLSRAHLHQLIWTEVRDAIQTRYPTADAHFIWSYSQQYAQGMAMTVRRLTDDDAGTRSLWRLIEAIRRNPHVMTPDRYAQLTAGRGSDADWVALAPQMFRDTHGAGGDALHLPQLVADQARLRADYERVRSYADKVVAHLDPDGPLQQLTFAELRQALDDLTDVFNRYHNLLTGGVAVEFKSLFIQPDWEEPLRLSLFPLGVQAFAWPDPRGYI